jgi:heterodisulfide reductase subunit C
MKETTKLRLESGSFSRTFQERLEELSGQDLFTCYQCGKCSAGCLSAEAMDVPPHAVVRLAWLGQEEELARLNTYWLCAACLTCDLRCPKGIDVSRIMEALRVMFLRPREESDEVSPESLSKEMLGRIPQQALVAGLRKYTK